MVRLPSPSLLRVPTINLTRVFCVHRTALRLQYEFDKRQSHFLDTGGDTSFQPNEIAMEVRPLPRACDDRTEWR